MGDTFYPLSSIGLAVGACGVVGIAPEISMKSTGPVLPSREHEPGYTGLNLLPIKPIQSVTNLIGSYAVALIEIVSEPRQANCEEHGGTTSSNPTSSSGESVSAVSCFVARYNNSSSSTSSRQATVPISRALGRASSPIEDARSDPR